MSIISKVIVQLQIEGLHKRENCPLEDVSFLRDLHRHIFYITCAKGVSHNDREVEIIMLKREIQQYLNNKYGNIQGYCNFGNISCEMIAQELIEKFNLYYCQVLEDNENGALLYSDEV